MQSFFFFPFGDKVSLCSPVPCVTLVVSWNLLWRPADLELTCFCLQSVGNKGICYQLGKYKALSYDISALKKRLQTTSFPFYVKAQQKECYLFIPPWSETLFPRTMREIFLMSISQSFVSILFLAQTEDSFVECILTLVPFIFLCSLYQNFPSLISSALPHKSAYVRTFNG